MIFFYKEIADLILDYRGNIIYSDEEWMNNSRYFIGALDSSRYKYFKLNPRDHDRERYQFQYFGSACGSDKKLWKCLDCKSLICAECRFGYHQNHRASYEENIGLVDYPTHCNCSLNNHLFPQRYDIRLTKGCCIL